MAAFTSSFILASFLLAISTLQLLSPAGASSSAFLSSLDTEDLPPPDGIIIAESDLQALMAVKSALIDPLSVLQSWNSSSYGGACGGSWVGVKCAKGQVIALQLANKALGGSLSPQIGQLFALRKLNLHSNSIQGAIPSSLSMLPNLRGLYLNRNQFSGSIPPALATSPFLQRIDLSHNSLSGLIPAFVVSANSTSTSVSAQSSSSSSSGSRLYFIDLSYNNFSSSLSASSFAFLPSLLELRISHSSLQGSVPSALTNLFPSLSILDLSHNELNGSLPQLPVSNLTFLDLSFNALTGSISADLISNLTFLNALNVSNNGLSSTIPAAIGNLTSLQALDLSVNSFNGSLPPSLADLKNLTFFNCSLNNLTGGVPAFVHKFDKSSFAGNEGLCGYDASVACAFQSPPPSSPWISSTPSDSNATSSLTPNPDQSGGRKRRFSRATFLVIVIGSVAAGLLLICLLSALICIFCRQMGSSSATAKRDDLSSSTKTKTNSGADSSNADEYGGQKFNSGRISSGGKEKDSYGSGGGGGGGEVGGGKLVHFDGSLRFTADGLLCATAEVLGKSTYGTVYKATFEDGSEVAVKRLREGVVKSQRDFEMEVNVLGKIRHPNLLSLRGYYWGPKNEKLLIFDFMPGGSLSAFLHARGPETPLTWHTRLNIAAGAARGLAHLHATEHIIHGNLTAGNILLDARMNSKLSDFGLSRLMTSAANANVIATATALGYRAPELTKLRKATTRSDVYSFGVVLLELLTGKSPAEATSGDQTAGMDLPEWVASIVKEEWTNEIFDLELMKGSAPTEDELINTLQLAMNCVAPSPGSRPSMEEISRHLDETLRKPDQHQHQQQLMATATATTTSSDSSAV